MLPRRLVTARPLLSHQLLLRRIPRQLPLLTQTRSLTQQEIDDPGMVCFHALSPAPHSLYSPPPLSPKIILNQAFRLLTPSPLAPLTRTAATSILLEKTGNFETRTATGGTSKSGGISASLSTKIMIFSAFSVRKSTHMSPQERRHFI